MSLSDDFKRRQFTSQLSYNLPLLEESWIAIEGWRASPYPVTPEDSPTAALSSEEEEEEEEEIIIGRKSAAEVDLDTSLSRLMSRARGPRTGSDDSDTEIAFKHSTRRRVHLSTVKIIPDQEMDQLKGISDTDAPRIHKRRRRKAQHNSSSSDQRTAKYVAGLSFVAGISFSAGYFMGRRTGMLRATN